MARGRYSKSRRDGVTRQTSRNDAQSGARTAIASVGGAQRSRGGRGVRARARQARILARQIAGTYRQPSGGGVSNS